MTDKDTLYFELLEALQGGGCALCRLARKASDSYVNALLYEGVIDVPIRDELRNARGLCYRHAWRMTGKRGSVLGTAIIYRDVVNTLAMALEEATAAPGRWRGNRDSLDRRLAPTTECPACRLEADAERRAAKTLIKHLGAQEVTDAYLVSGGLCLPHFRLLLSHASAKDAEAAARWQGKALSRLRDELDELIRKHDYRFQHEPVAEGEADAWQRAVAALVGEAEPEEGYHRNSQRSAPTK
jgi:Family of unknown function (DUF6062)